MNRSYKIAIGIMFAAFVWVGSGLFYITDNEKSDDLSSTISSNESSFKVRTKQSIARQHQKTLVLFGRTEAVRSIDVKVETPGRIIEVPLKKGKFVKKGEKIAQISMGERTARLKEAEAMVKRFTIAYEAAQKLSKKQFRSKVQLAESMSNLESARASLRSVKIDIQRTAVRAPFDGVLNDINIAVGDYVGIGDTCATIVDLDPITVVGGVTEQASRLLKVGDEATVRLIGGDELLGVITYISKVGSELTRTFRIEVFIENPKGIISEGLTAELELKMGNVKAHFLSPAALTLNELGELGVKVVNSASRVQFHKVKIIDDTQKGVWLGGLPDNIDLIIVGQEFVRSNQKVQSINMDRQGSS